MSSITWASRFPQSTGKRGEKQCAPRYGRGRKPPIIIIVMKKKLVLLALAALFVCARLTSETSEVYAPFVSRLKAAVRGPQIKLTWKDSPDVAGVYVVYRHTRDITPESFRDAQPVAQVASGVEYYIDAPNEPGEYHYAVLVEADGRIFDIFIPFRNTTNRPVPVLTTMPVADLAAAITDIRAKPEADGITVTFAASRADRDLLVYRSTTPILTAERLAALKPAKKLKSSETRVTDYPVPGIPYYYAVVDAGLWAAGTAVLEPEKSASVSGAEIPLKREIPRQAAAQAAPAPAGAETPQSAAAPAQPAVVSPRTAAPPGASGRREETARRPVPLPYLILSGQVSGSGGLPERASVPPPRTLPPETARAAAAAVAKAEKPAPRPMEPRLLETDRTPGPAKEDFTLKTILDGPFREKKWRETERLLDNYTALNLSEDARARARFYRAQSYFFQARYQDSFMEFLLAQDRYYPDVRPWLDEILLRLRLTADPS